MFGIDKNDLDFILTNQDLIKENINKDPSKLALNGIPRSICTQIKYLSRCRTKIPHYYQCRCIIPPISYEQCSSFQSSSTREYSGESCLDLTCGLGVDSFQFSKHFKTVISIEQDTLLYQIAKENFKRLKAENISVINADSREFVNNYQGDRFDLIFVDPARRNENERVFLFEKSSPNIIELLPILKKIAKKIVIKSSPMFDIKEAFKIFGESCNIETISLQGECKELIIEIGEHCRAENRVCVVKTDGGFKRYSFQNRENNSLVYSKHPIEEYRYVVIPDIGFIKNRVTEALFESYLPNLNPLEHSLPTALCMDQTDDISVRCFPIEQIFEYNSKKITDYLKSKQIKSATIILKSFPHSLESIKKRLKIKDGSQKTLIATTINKKAFIIVC